MLHKRRLAGSGLIVWAALGCNAGPNTGPASSATAKSAPSPLAPPLTTSSPPSTPAGSGTAGGTTTAPSGSTTGTGSTADPAFYTTPTVTGATHLVTVTPGQSLATVFKAAQPGDVIELQPGTYAAPNGPALETPGTPSAWIVVRGAAGSTPVIDLQGSGELHVGASYLLLENVAVVKGAGNNIHITPSTTTTAVKDVILRNVSSTSMASGTGAALKIAGNWNNGTGVPTDGVYIESCELAGSIDNACLDAVAVRHAVVRDCYIHDPVAVSMKSPGLFFKGGSSDILVERCLVRGIHGNGAIMVGGDTGAQWFDALYANPKVEGANQVFRNNVLADFDDSAFEVRGCHGAKIHNNTIVTGTRFTIFRFTWGGSGSGTQIGNYSIDATNNLVLASGSPTYAQNDGNSDATLSFGPTLWGGTLQTASGPALPSFPQQGDVLVAPSGGFANVVLNPSFTGLTGLADAEQRYVLVPASAARGAGSASTVAHEDILRTARSASAPSLGAFE